MARKKMKAKIRWAGEEAWLKGNMDALDEVYAADYVSHRPPLPDVVGLEEVKAYLTATRGAYTELRISYDEMVGEGDTIAYRFTWQGKHTGQSATLPIPPTNKVVTLVGATVDHIRDGKVVEEFEYSDYLGFLQQLGVVPPLG